MKTFLTSLMSKTSSLFLLILISCNSKPIEESLFFQNSTFYRFLALNHVKIRISTLENNAEIMNDITVYQQIIDLIDSSQIDKDVNFYDYALNKKAIAYHNLNKPKEAQNTIKNLGLWGGSIIQSDSIKYTALYSQYPTYHKIYEESLDAKIIKKLNNIYSQDNAIQIVCSTKFPRINNVTTEEFMQCVDSSMSAHFHFLDSITQQKGYPNIFSVGKHGLQAIDVINRHSKIVAHEKIYETMKQSCEKGEIPWRCLEIVESDYWRKEPIGKIRHLYFTEMGALDMEKSLFALFAHAALLYKGAGTMTFELDRDDTYFEQHPQDSAKYELFLVYFPNETENDARKYTKALHQVKDYLISQHIDPKRITISTTPILVPKDTSLGYRIGFKAIK